MQRIRTSGEQGKVLAIDYHITESAVSQIRHGKRWGWLKFPMA